jgi:hypothetical protein
VPLIADRLVDELRYRFPVSIVGDFLRHIVGNMGL